MDVFQLREQLLSDYRSYTSSFLQIHDKHVRAYVDHALEKGALTPDPRIQLNPAYEPGPLIEELVTGGVLHGECRNVFRVGKTAENTGGPLRLYRHQAEAIEAAASGASYVLTTGTGSGKSLAYIVPIVDYTLRHPERRGMRRGR